MGCVGQREWEGLGENRMVFSRGVAWGIQVLAGGVRGVQRNLLPSRRREGLGVGASVASFRQAG